MQEYLLRRLISIMLDISLEQQVAEILMGDVKFISYDGKYPTLCSGMLVLKVGSREFKIQRIRSGGGVWIDKQGDEQVDVGDWDVEVWPDDFPETLKKRALEIINENVEHGCCGGCI